MYIIAAERLENSGNGESIILYKGKEDYVQDRRQANLYHLEDAQNYISCRDNDQWYFYVVQMPDRCH